MVRKAVLPVAGWGTRFLPATKAMPKEMFPIIDKPVIQFIVEECLHAGRGKHNLYYRKTQKTY
jgi:UTP--glucose-1-phosphate uridylyltransferase